MILKLRQRMAREESGFTLVELLVVMLILGLLAAIAIPAFFNQKNKATDSDAKESVRTAQTAMETFATDHNGKYDGTNVSPADTPDAAKLTAIENTLSNADISNVTAGPDSYSLTVTSDTDNTFTIARTGTGTLTYTCTVPTGNDRGGCPEGDNWGG